MVAAASLVETQLQRITQYAPSRARLSRGGPLGGRWIGINAQGALEASAYVIDIIWSVYHDIGVGWVVEIGDEFEPEFFALHDDVRTEILALSRLLQQFGPQLGRSRVDTLNGSRHANMKELRFSAVEGEWLSASTRNARPSCL